MFSDQEIEDFFTNIFLEKLAADYVANIVLSIKAYEDK